MKIIESGKRKTSIARAVITEGSGKVRINKQNYENFQEFDRLKIKEPLIIAEQILERLNFDIEVIVRGGGEKSQIDASRLALARAIVSFTKLKDTKKAKEVEKAFLSYDRNLLVADIRRKEAYKPGDSKARAKRQSSKR